MYGSDLQPGAAAAVAYEPARLDELWAQVPKEYRTWSYDLRQPPFDRVFRGSRARRVELDVTGVPESIRRELAWWVWSSPTRYSRRVPVTCLQRFVEALNALLEQIEVSSTVEIDRHELSRAYRSSYHRRRRTLPRPSSAADLESEVRLLQNALHRVYSRRPWWHDDHWAPRDDPRIPIRSHEPCRAQSISFAGVAPAWLRVGAKQYARIGLETETLTWGTLHGRVGHIASHLADFIAERDLHGPALVERPDDQLRGLMLDFQGWLRTRPGRPARGQPNGTATLSPLSINQVKVSVRRFYEFLVDHRHQLAEATGDARFLDLSGAHLRLWRPTDGPRRRRQRSSTQGYIEDGDLAQMIENVSVLGLPKDQHAIVTSGGETRAVAGLGDPTAMRAWLIQALTGRRANEILMLDFNPLLPVPGLDDPTGRDDPIPKMDPPVNGDQQPDDHEFTAKLRYQQTKIDGAPDTILVGEDVVALITEQQEWVRERLRHAPGQPEPVYLFPGLNHNARGTGHRSMRGYHTSLQKLTGQLALRDRQGRVLEFNKSHRLRHTKATTLLNLGVPLHVVMRYMGHLSPEMTLHYGQTLAETAEREFLRARKLGHDGRELQISPRDVYDMVSLSTRTDRILPTGICLLPPTKRCDRGNACYQCGHFATDSTFLDAHRELLTATERLVAQRAAQHLARTGRAMTDDNVWLVEQHATIAALQNLISRLDTTETSHAVKGAGCGAAPQGPVPIELTHRPPGSRNG